MAHDGINLLVGSSSPSSSSSSEHWYGEMWYEFSSTAPTCPGDFSNIFVSYADYYNLGHANGRKENTGSTISCRE